MDKNYSTNAKEYRFDNTIVSVSSFFDAERNLKSAIEEILVDQIHKCYNDDGVTAVVCQEKEV